MEKSNTKKESRYIDPKGIRMDKNLSFCMVKSHLITHYFIRLTYDSYGLERDLEILENLAHGKHDEMMTKSMPEDQLTFVSYFSVAISFYNDLDYYGEIVRKVDLKSNEWEFFDKNEPFKGSKVLREEITVSKELMFSIVKSELFKEYEKFITYRLCSDEVLEVMEKLANGDYDEMLKQALSDRITLDNYFIAVDSFKNDLFTYGEIVSEVNISVWESKDNEQDSNDDSWMNALGI